MPTTKRAKKNRIVLISGGHTDIRADGTMTTTRFNPKPRAKGRVMLRDGVAALLLKLDQSHPTNALWNHAGVDYYDAADQIIALLKRRRKLVLAALGARKAGGV